MAARALPVALAGACGYAAFAGGAVAAGDHAWLQAALAVLALVAAAALAGGRLQVAGPRAAWLGVGLLAAFAAWSGLSLAWSVAPDRTWEATNRALVFALAAGLGLAAGAGGRRAVGRFAAGWLVVSCAVALYALAGKVVPGVVDHAALIARLRAPLEYWNALAAVCAFGVPVAVALAADTGRALRARLAGLAAAWLLLLVAGLTYSRGGVLAIAVAMAVLTALSPARLRVLVAFGAALAAAVPALAVAFGRAALTTNEAPLPDRAAAGRVLLLALVACLVALVAAGPRLLAWGPRVPRALLVRAAQATLVLAVLVLTGVAATDRGIDGAVRAATDGFTQAGGEPIGDPSRLAEAGSGNRWLWWREAAGAWWDRPAGGWGAGSFPVTHRLYRAETIDVAQPHSVPLQWLAETGLIGLLLAAGGLLALLAAALAGVRRARGDGAALVALAVAAGVHALFEWDWDIPAVTLPAVLALAVVAARPADPSAPRRAGAFVDLEPRGGGGAAGLAVATLALAAVVLSGALPALSDAKAGAALVAGGERGAAQAELAARLDPTAVRPLLAAAAIAEGRDRPLEAREALVRAVRRQPWSAEAWLRLAENAAVLNDRPGAARAARRALELDPLSEPARLAALATTARLAPAEASPTAPGTPLPVAPAAPVAPVAP